MGHRHQSDTPFSYRVEYVPGTRRIEIFVRDNRDVVVRAPRGTPVEKIHAFVQEHADTVVRDLNPTAPPPDTDSFTAPGRAIPFSVERRPRCRTVTVEVREGGRVVVKTPPAATREEIVDVLRAHETWLLRTLAIVEKGGLRGEEHASVVAGGTTVPYVIAYRSRAVNLTLNILPDNTVRVTVPATVSKDVVRAFVESQADFIHEKIAAPGRTPARQFAFEDGETLLVLGKKATIRVIQANNGQGASLAGDTLLVPADRPVRETVSAFLRRTTWAEVNRYLPRYAGALRVAVPQIHVRSLKTCWGNCRADSRIVFNERLAMLPTDLIEYVVAHELCHIRYPHHQKTFYDALRTVLQDADERKARMKNYHPCWGKGDPL
ncbi:MAG: hypothetical protein PWP08_574 [Methanofollis sp.]|nr:hypothetical protein [Methanofollis sp.]